MKRKMIIFICLLFSTSLGNFAFGQETSRYIKLADQYCNQGYNFVCLGLMIRLQKLGQGRHRDYIAGNIERIVEQSGDEIFDQLQTLDLVRLRSPVLYPLIGKRLIEQGDLKNAIRVLSLVSSEHKAYALALHYKGIAYQLSDDPSQAITLFQDCVKESKRYANRGSDLQKKRYSVNADTCRANIARSLYQEKKYKKALKYWNSIDKKSYIWPLTLIEKAWAYYYLKDYNRALGLLVTYKSPLLESYFIPEAEVLKALSYYRMCIYEDTDQVIKRFTEIYEPRSRKLKRILEKYRENDIYFFNLAVKSFDKLPKESFVRKLAISLFKNPRFERMLSSYKAALNELKVIRGSKLRNKAVENYIKKSAYFVRRSINDYIKRNFFNFINEMHAYSGELFKINLEIFRSKKNLVKKDVDVDKKSRKRGSLKHVRREEDQYFWKFFGGFWADELGGYSFGLKNQCQQINKEGEA